MSTPDEVLCIRQSVAVSRLEHVVCLRVSGDDAYEALEALCPADLRLIDGQIRHTLLLDPEAVVRAELLVCRDQDDFLLLAEGPTEQALWAHVRAHVPDAIEVTGLGATHALLGLNGPYAWELVDAVFGPGAGAVPYLTHFRIDGGWCLRAGTCGEYGYLLLVERPLAAPLLQSLLERPALDVGMAGLEALDQCALESWFFNARREGQAGLTPLELQLQWRVSPRKRFIGSEALEARRAQGIRARTTCLVGEAVAVGDPVWYGGRNIGRVLNAGFSPVLERAVGMAILDMPFAQPGIDVFEVETAGSRRPVRTVSPPLINNRSLYVDPRRHRYATRHLDRFPPLR